MLKYCWQLFIEITPIRLFQKQYIAFLNIELNSLFLTKFIIFFGFLTMSFKITSGMILFNSNDKMPVQRFKIAL